VKLLVAVPAMLKALNGVMKGKKPDLEEPATEPPDSGVLDLMSRLRASLAEGLEKRGLHAPGRRPSPPVGK
jgi:hypothetical protein